MQTFEQPCICASKLIVNLFKAFIPSGQKKKELWLVSANLSAKYVACQTVGASVNLNQWKESTW